MTEWTVTIARVVFELDVVRAQPVLVEQFRIRGDVLEKVLRRVLTYSPAQINGHVECYRKDQNESANKGVWDVRVCVHFLTVLHASMHTHTCMSTHPHVHMYM